MTNGKTIALTRRTSNTEEAEVKWFYEDLQDLLELTPKKGVFTSQGTEMQK